MNEQDAMSDAFDAIHGIGEQCEHEFARHVGVKVFNKTGMAWVQLSLVIGGEDLPEMWICTKCGEGGYEVPAGRDIAGFGDEVLDR